MSVIMNYEPDRLTKVFFGCSPDDVKKTVILTLGIHWLFKRISRRKFVVKRSQGWWNLAVMKCGNLYATMIAAGCGSSEVTDIVRLLTRFPCENIIGVGLAGALKKEIQIGDIIVPVQAIPAFVENVNEAVGHSDELYLAYRNLLREFCIEMGVHLHEGMICTIDAITSENLEFYAYAKRMDLLGVDMETFHLYRVAGKAGFKVSSFHVVSDNPMQHKSVVDEVPESDIARKREVYRKMPALIKSIAIPELTFS
jgi:purine-nucleoside phosphorylase